MKTRILRLVATVRLVVLASALQVPLVCYAQTAETYHARADQALQSFLVKFWDGGHQYLRNRFPDDGSLTGYWTYANGWDALMDGVERTGGQHYYGLIESLYFGQEERGWFAGYYDDECWMTMALIRAYDLTGDPRYLNQAKTLFDDIKTGWDSTCCGANPGGMWWDKAHTQKATAANAGAALAGVSLYRRTGEASFLDFAQQVYGYWHSNMVNKVTFQVADHFQTNGSKVLWKFTYNEGLMIGAAVELNEATGNAGYLTDAQNIAGFMIKNEVTSTSYGKVLFDGTSSDCGGDCHQFKGPAYRYLMRLYAKDTSQKPYFDVLKASADAIWNLARNKVRTLFAINWAGPLESSVDELQDNAACVALSRFAQQYGVYPGSGVPANQFEAENASLRHIGLESTYSGFTGWGYVAGWNGDGQGIDFKVNFATAGTRELILRYAAGAGNASRAIYINGAGASTNLIFPSTTAWSNYNTISVSYDFPPGPSTISLIFKSSTGSSNWLNLDNLTIPPPGPLTVAVHGESALVSWSGPGLLQSAPAVSGPWSDIANSAGSPFMISGPEMGVRQHQFYRLRQ